MPAKQRDMSIEVINLEDAEGGERGRMSAEQVDFLVTVGSSTLLAVSDIDKPDGVGGIRRLYSAINSDQRRSGSAVR